MGASPGNILLSFTQAEHSGTESSPEADAKATTGAKDGLGAEAPSGVTPISAVVEGEHATTGAAGETGHTATAEVKNPILPVGPELAWGAVTFFLLWALMKFVLLKPVMKGMEDRSEKIRSDVKAADDAKVSADQSLADYDASLHSARAEATRIIEDARAQGEAKRRELVAAAEAEVNAERTAANEQVAAAKADAMARIRTDVATIAVGAAGAVVGKQLDVEANRSTVDQYLSRAGS